MRLSLLTLFVGAFRSNKLLWVQDCIFLPVEALANSAQGESDDEKHFYYGCAPRGDRAETGTDFAPDAVSEICESLRALLADAFTLYLKPRIFTGI